MPSNEPSMIHQIQKAEARINGWPEWKKKIFEELFSPKANPSEGSQKAAQLNPETIALNSR